ncbi:hypothetical protein Tco_1361297 [Tanacetum coccineum]
MMDTTDSDTPDNHITYSMPIPHGRPFVIRGPSSDFHSDASYDPSIGLFIVDHSLPDLPGTSTGPSRKRRRSPMTSVPALSPVSRALSPIRADLTPSPKRVKDSGYLTDVEVDDRRMRLVEGDAIDGLVMELFRARSVVRAIDRDEDETGCERHRGSGHDHTQAILVHRIQVIEGVQREQGHRIVRVDSAVITLTERIAELERDNRRLRDTGSVESQRVYRLQRSMSRMQRGGDRDATDFDFMIELRVGRLDTVCARSTWATVLRDVLVSRISSRTLEPLRMRKGVNYEGENGWEWEIEENAENGNGRYGREKWKGGLEEWK